MGTLIPLKKNDDGEQAVLGRDLWEFLEVGKKYATWFEDMTGYGFIAGQDFVPFSGKTPTGGRPRKDHILTLDMAKELSMIQRTDKGKQARAYFIDCEKRAREAIPALDTEDILRLALEAEMKRKELEQKNSDLETMVEGLATPAAAWGDLADKDGLIYVNDAAKMLEVGPNKFREELRRVGVFQSSTSYKNRPYQSYVQRGFFKEKINVWVDAYGDEKINATTFVTVKGMEWLHKKMGEGLFDAIRNEVA